MGGSGIPIYRKLVREEIPFATGILYENDVDYEAARYLATHVVAQTAFEPVGEIHYEQSLEWMKRCGKVICCLERFGAYNQENRKLLEEARIRGMLVTNL